MVQVAMGLGRLLAEADAPGGRRSGTTASSSPPENKVHSPSKSTAADDLGERVRIKLIDSIGATLSDSNMSQDELRRQVSDELERLIAQENLPLTDIERNKLVGAVASDVLGFGPIEPLLEDDDVSEIMVNGTDAIYVERAGKIEMTDIRFRTEAHLRQVINRIVAAIGRRVDESSPMVDARLADGSRVNAVIPPLAVDGSSLTIRKFAKQALQAGDLVRIGAITQQSLTVMRACVLAHLNVVVSGGTGSGKTTFLNMLSSFIGTDERIVTIEDAVELKLMQRHVIRLECRPPNVEGKGAVTTRDLLKNTLRMRPDRIIVGECRGGEALDMLQAMNTGHDGSLTTLHANSPRDATRRLETMVLYAGFEIPQRAIREQISGAVDIICQLERLRNGRRVVTSITEVVGMEGEHITLNELFTFDHEEGVLKATGVRPQCADKLAKHGVVIDAEALEN
jgi:pilus assembly protein CpaF